LKKPGGSAPLIIHSGIGHNLSRVSDKLLQASLTEIICSIIIFGYKILTHKPAFGLPGHILMTLHQLQCTNVILRPKTRENDSVIDSRKEELLSYSTYITGICVKGLRETEIKSVSKIGNSSDTK
jgi:hypothetical protein